MDDKDEPAAPVFVRPGIEPFRREHRVLRRLYDGRPVRPVCKTNETLDAQEVVAPVLRETAQRAREVQTADRAVEHDRECRDAVGVRRFAPGHSLSPIGGEGRGEGATGAWYPRTPARPRRCPGHPLRQYERGVLRTEYRGCGIARESADDALGGLVQRIEALAQSIAEWHE